MPVSKYYGGHGTKVMKAMRKQYHSEKKAKEVFYATANKYGKKPRGSATWEDKEIKKGYRVVA